MTSREVERLDSLQLAMWQKAMDGDAPSAIAVVRCIMSRRRLLGLEGPSMLRAGDPRPRTLVVQQETKIRTSACCTGVASNSLLSVPCAPFATGD